MISSNSLNHGTLADESSSLKVNFKLGGTNHEIVKGFGLLANTMIVGADVTHPGRASALSCPSIAGVVATISDAQQTYLASARLQEGMQEVVIFLLRL